MYALVVYRIFTQLDSGLVNIDITARKNWSTSDDQWDINRLYYFQTLMKIVSGIAKGTYPDKKLQEIRDLEFTAK